MTNIDFRTTTILRPTEIRATPASDGTTGASPKQRAPRWIAPIGIAAAICIAGVGILTQDAGQPAPSLAANEDTVTIGDGQVVWPGMPDGFWQPVSEGAANTATLATTPTAQAGMPDGYWQPITVYAATAATLATSRTAQPGMADGYWQPTSVAPVGDRAPSENSDSVRLSSPGRPDGSWQQPSTEAAAAPLADRVPSMSVDNVQFSRPGMPDGSWQQPSTDAAARTFGCKISGPC